MMKIYIKCKNVILTFTSQLILSPQGGISQLIKLSFISGPINTNSKRSQDLLVIVCKLTSL